MTIDQERRKSGPIRSVTPVTMGWGEAHDEHINGTRKPALWWIFAGRRWVRIPLNVFVVEHDQGLILFDTGQDPAIVTDPDYWPDAVTRLFMNHIFRFDIGPEDTLAHHLALAGFDARDVRTAVISHLHADHVGGIGDVPQAQLVVSTEAWAHMLGPHPEREMVLRRDIDVPGAKWTRIEVQPTVDESLAPFTHSHDLMGDGSMILLPTPGHLPGSISMLVRSEGVAPVLFVADACYSVEALMEDRFPGTGDGPAMRETFASIRGLAARTPGLVIVPSHDPGAADAVRTVWPASPHAASPGSVQKKTDDRA